MEMNRFAFAHMVRPFPGRLAAGAVRAFALGVATFSLASCVASETSLINEAAPTMGPLFTVQVFRDFVDGRAHDLKASTYRWEDGAYVNVGGAPDLRRFVSLTMTDDLQLIQGSDAGKRIFTYWLVRKVAVGTYQIRPLDEGDVDAGKQKTHCARQVQGGLCLVSTKEHLLALAEATAHSPVKEAEIAVIVENGLTPAPAFIDVRR